MRGVAFAETARACSLAIVASLVTCGSASAETLMLNDGSVIRGDIKTLQDDVYTIETDSLGTIRVRKQDVRVIDRNDEAELGPPVLSSIDESPPEQADLQAIQSRMMQIPDLFSMIEALRSDPDMQAVLSDPEILNALASGDFATLMNNPKIIALTGNAKVRDVIEKVE